MSLATYRITITTEELSDVMDKLKQSTGRESGVVSFIKKLDLIKAKINAGLDSPAYVQNGLRTKSLNNQLLEAYGNDVVFTPSKPQPTEADFAAGMEEILKAEQDIKSKQED